MIVALARVAGRPQHADVGANAGNQQRLDFEPAQDLIELGAEEYAEAPFDDADVIRVGLKRIDNLEALAALYTGRRRRRTRLGPGMRAGDPAAAPVPQQPAAIDTARTVRLLAENHRYPGAARGGDEAGDPRHHGFGAERVGADFRIDEIVLHIDDGQGRSADDEIVHCPLSIVHCPLSIVHCPLSRSGNRRQHLLAPQPDRVQHHVLGDFASPPLSPPSPFLTRWCRKCFGLVRP